MELKKSYEFEERDIKEIALASFIGYVSELLNVNFIKEIDTECWENGFQFKHKSNL